jgi:hypothetical protein
MQTHTNTHTRTRTHIHTHTRIHTRVHGLETEHERVRWTQEAAFDRCQPSRDFQWQARSAASAQPRYFPCRMRMYVCERVCVLVWLWFGVLVCVGVVLCGMVVVWCVGVCWCSVVWCGVVVVLCCVVWWCCVVWCGVWWCCVVWCGCVV